MYTVKSGLERFNLFSDLNEKWDIDPTIIIEAILFDWFYLQVFQISLNKGNGHIPGCAQNLH